MSKKNAEAVAALGLREDHSEMLTGVLDRLDKVEKAIKDAASEDVSKDKK
jgi:hypothetical protein